MAVFTLEEVLERSLALNRGKDLANQLSLASM